MCKLSIIIPVYNTAQYLRQCMNSVVNQTLKDIEIICVDDGSTDESGQILDEYALKDTRIKVIHKCNQGLVAARKTGLNIASGKYIGYVDSDDWIEAEMYEELYYLAEDYRVELVTSGYLLEGNYTTVHKDTLDEGKYCGDSYQLLLNNVIYKKGQKETGIRASLCCKLFLKEKLIKAQNSIPEELTMAEDKMCLLSYILECNSVYVYKKAFYHYRINASSMVHVPNPKYLLAVNAVYQFLMNLYQHPNFTKEMRTQAEIYITELIFKGINSLLGFQNQNTMWIDPYWMDKIPNGSRVVLYGAGALGKKYKTHIENRDAISYVGCVDPNFEKNTSEDFLVQPIEMLQQLEFDYIVITIKNSIKAKEVKEKLREVILEEKILWFEQPEVFWKYMEADGLL